MAYEKIIHIDLFSGIGGFALAADRVFGNVEHIFCDNDDFCKEVLKKHWPTAPIYGDIRTLTYASWQRRQQESASAFGNEGTDEGWATKKNHKPKRNDKSTERPFILTGGFPCQPFSQAGRRRGAEDDRFLWPEMRRVIGEFNPEWVIAENVRGLLTQGGGVVFEQVCADLEALGYEVQPLVIPAVAVGAPHRRDRVWFIAHLERERLQRSRHESKQQAIQQKNGVEYGYSDAQNPISKRARRRHDEPTESPRGGMEPEVQDARPDWGRDWLEVATRLCRVDDGLPRRLDRNPRLKALGNAIVPQVAEEIMRAIRLSR